MKKILFISHDGSRSGAPLVLLSLIKWMHKTENSIMIDILFLRNGPLIREFDKYCANIYVINKEKKQQSFKRLFYSKLKKKFGFSGSDTNNVINNLCQDYNLIYANTVVSVPIAVQLKKQSVESKLLVHIHELNCIINEYVPDFDIYLNSIDSIIAVSEQVKTNLIENWNTPRNLIEVVYPFSSVKIDKLEKVESSKFTVGASGLSYWRKGNDLFLQVARYINKNYPNLEIEFIWVGNEYNDKPIIDADIEKLGLKEKVIFVGETSKPEVYFNDFDVFLLTSREDPFPLVCIEVAHLKKPIICFEGASGTAEVIENGGGFVVPYMDIEEMGDKIAFYYNNRGQLKKDGDEANDLFSDFTPDKICPIYFNTVIKVVNL